MRPAQNSRHDNLQRFSHSYSSFSARSKRQHIGPVFDKEFRRLEGAVGNGVMQPRVALRRPHVHVEFIHAYQFFFYQISLIECTYEVFATYQKASSRAVATCLQKTGEGTGFYSRAPNLDRLLWTGFLVAFFRQEHKNRKQIM